MRLFRVAGLGLESRHAATVGSVERVVLRISIDRETCIGSGNCVHWSPAVFDQDDEGYAIVIDAAGDTEDKIREAARNCPTRSITVD
jgi:ferredoxin